jgi:hypothetical protein
MAPDRPGRAVESPAEQLSRRLFAGARDREQAAHRILPSDDVEAIRRDVRRLARAEGVHIRTGIVDDALVVIRADAELWTESAATMREKLRPRDL